MTQTAIAIELFSKKTHEGIVSYLNEYAQYLPLTVDDRDFVRHYINDVPFFTLLHHDLTDFASEMFGEKLKPSYSFLSMYQDGGTCPLHIDRPQCYRTIDYLIQQDEEEPWPLRIGKPMSEEERQTIFDCNKANPETKKEIASIVDSTEWDEILLKPNDAALYSGTHSWHYRPSKLNGSASLVFWHFVKEDFDGPLN